MMIQINFRDELKEATRFPTLIYSHVAPFVSASRLKLELNPLATLRRSIAPTPHTARRYTEEEKRKRGGSERYYKLSARRVPNHTGCQLLYAHRIVATVDYCRLPSKKGGPRRQEVHGLRTCVDDFHLENNIRCICAYLI